MFRRRVEETDEHGRRRTIVTEEPPQSAGGDSPVRDSEVVGEEEEVVRSRINAWELARGWVRTVGIWAAVALGIVEAILAFRLGFLLVGANPNNGFVDFIYDLSGPLVDPFEGIAGRRSVDGGVFEPATLIAMVVYLVAALLLIAVLWAATAGPWPVEKRSMTTRTQRRTPTS